MLAPQMATVARVDQLRTDVDAISKLYEATGHNGLDPQLPANCLNVGLSALWINSLVAGSCAVRYHGQTGQSRQPVGQIVGHSISQARYIQIRAGASKRKNRHGVDRFSRVKRGEVDDTHRGGR